MQIIPISRPTLLALAVFLIATGAAISTAAAEEWAAVARSKSNPAIYGWSSKQKTPDAADALALKRCQSKDAKDCDTEGLFDDICNGYASAGSAAFMANGRTETLSGANTLRECQKTGAKNCRLHFTLCPWNANPVIQK
jgi:hypothetical protein